MATRRRQPIPDTSDTTRHPIVAFASLLRAEDRGDRRLVRESLQRLDDLGYNVILMPPRGPRGEHGQ